MTYRISLQPGGHEFEAAADQTVLEAAHGAGLLLPHSCRDGACGACKGKVLEGTVDYGKFSAGALSESDRAEGYALFCCARPQSNLVVEARNVTRAGDIPVKKLPCRVQKLQRLAEDVMLIDHGNCEKKAAGAAFQLMFRYIDKPDLQNKMSRLAREELRHFEQVLAIVRRREIPLRNVGSSRYAAGLRELVRNHEPYRLTDTLVIGAFIEARSCERFAMLVPHLDEELGKFYHGLLKSEARHFQDYLKLAYQYGEPADVDATIIRVRERERELIESPDDEFRFHSGVPLSA
jgi:tRNA-(ms[2]io[6]A)-hydroxylase